MVQPVPQYLIAGNGRVARHFAHYFSLLHIPFRQWHRGQPDEVLRAPATHALLLVKDDAIEEVAGKVEAGIKVHFSGSLVTPAAFGAHPLMTFGEQLYTLEKYEEIPFIVDENAPAFETLLPGLPNARTRLAPELKAKYHAMCVLSGNFSCILWQKLFDTLGEFGVPPEFANAYLRQQTENLISDYKTALTGPLARGDAGTIAKNLEALGGDPFQDVYRSFVKAYQEEKKQ